MKKYIKGKYIEMTAEELEALNNVEPVETEPTILERLEAIEEALLEGVLSND